MLSGRFDRPSRTEIGALGAIRPPFQDRDRCSRADSTALRTRFAQTTGPEHCRPRVCCDAGEHAAYLLGVPIADHVMVTPAGRLSSMFRR
ncbi:hypothetical protein BE17_51980 [Sorangium cellulosum]|uniref:Uncharacterized protein n=1 Tax=Sorangium cellulosum TaxID=56 RepID=A0A150RMW4_SORCE|nr:hypothetical protein BE17_51980 [Sorangium cellulosum]